MIFVFVAIIFLFSFSINYFEEVFAEEELVCPVGEVAVIRVNNPKPICVDQNTAERWLQLGITEMVGEPIEEETEEIPPEIVESFEEVFAEEELVCQVGEVAVIRVNNPKPICIDQNTAQKWVQLGIIEIVGESIEEETKEIVPELEESLEDTMPEFRYTSIPDDFSRAQNALVTISGGDLTKPVTFQTFSKIEPGEQQKYITSFSDLGFDTYFSLESIPSMDKIEFYNLIAKTINPGKPPELFDVSIDVLAGDNSVIITIIYPKCNWFC